MKIVKYLFFLLLIGIIAGAIYVATKDGKYHLEETTLVNAPLPVVFNEVNNLYNWETWGPWRTENEDVIINYHEITRGDGAGFSWKSENMGNGTISTTKSIPDTTIEQEVSFNPTFAESNGDMYWRFEETEEGTLVTLGMEGSQSFREKLAFLFRDNTISETLRPRFSNSLARLNTAVENKMSEYTINVDGETTHGGGFYMYTTAASKMDRIQVNMQKMWMDVLNYMDTNNISRQGEPFLLYNNLDERNNVALYSAAIFTPSIIITPDNSEVQNGMMPVQRVVKTTLKGDYSNLSEAWERAYSYIDANNMQADEESQPFEVYTVRSDSTLNPANWITEIYIPVVNPTPTTTLE